MTKQIVEAFENNLPLCQVRLEVGTGLEGGDLVGDLSLALLVSELGSLVLLRLSGPVLARLVGGGEGGVLADLLEGLGPHVLEVLGADLLLESGGELLLESLVVFLLERLHVLSDVATGDVGAEEFGVEPLGLGVETGESLLGVGDEDSTIRGTLKGTEDTGTSGSALQTNIEEALEGTGLVITEGLNLGHLTIGLGNTLVLVSKTEDGKSTTGDEETSGVSGGPVGKTGLDTVAGELLGGSLGEDVVTVDLGVDDLAGDVTVGETNDKAVLGSVVLVLGLRNETLARVVVGTTLSSTTVLDLVTREVGARLDSLDERLCWWAEWRLRGMLV